MLNFCDFIQVFVFTTNHHLKERSKGNFVRENLKKIASLMKMRSTLKVP